MIGDKLDKLGRREKTLLAFSALCILVLIVDWSVVTPAARILTGMDREIANQAETLKLDLRVLEDKDRTEAEYGRVVNLLGKTASSAEASDRMNLEVDKLARQAGVDCPSMGPREPRQLPFYEQYFVEIGELRAEMRGLLEFLFELRESPGMLRVATMQLTPDRRMGTVKGTMLITKMMLPETSPDGGGMSTDSGE